MPNIAFRAHRDGTDATGFTVNDYAPLVWPTLAFDIGSRFTADKQGWMPVAEGEDPAIVVFHGQVWVSKNAPASGNYVAKLIKNGYPGTVLQAGIGVPGSFANSFVIPFSCNDLAQPGDVYRWWLFVTSATAVEDGNPAHSWWDGTVIG